MGRPRRHIDGQRFGKLVATGEVRKHHSDNYEHLCQCDCGNQSWVILHALTSGGTKSCGCARGEWKHLGSGVAARNEVLSYYKKSAEKRNITWELSNQKFDELIHGNCFYCNKIPFNVRHTRTRTDSIIYNGIDRVDNKSGYVASNCVSCCKICNRAKRDMSLKKFQEWIKDLVSYNV